MSIQTQFKQSLLVGFQSMISHLPSEANELELRLGLFTNPVSPRGHQAFIAGQNLVQFKNIMEQLQKKQYDFVETVTLDIEFAGSSPLKEHDYEKIRVSITSSAVETSLHKIRQYCLSNKIAEIDRESRQYLKKERFGKWDYHEYSLRGYAAKETLIEGENSIEEITQSLDDPSVNKYYRYKHRYSFSSLYSPLRFDLTLVKSATGTNFQKSGVLGQKESYEVEVEYIGHNSSTST